MVANFIACAAMEWESEFVAQAQLKRVLDANGRSNEYWVVLSNLTITDSRNLSANEIDFLLIGPTGLRLIEAKGWKKPFVQREWDIRVTKECELISKKARKLSGSLKQLPFDTGEIRGYLLLSEELSWEMPCKGVPLFGKQQISKILDDSRDTRLTKDQIDQVAMHLKPQDASLKLGRLKRLSDILLNPYEASRKPQPGRVLTGRKERLKAEVDVHVFDLSGERSDEHKEKARREADVIGALQKFPGIPKLIDSFQEANEFAGEIFFYAVEKPNGTPVSEKVTAADWTIGDRLSFTVKSLQYLSTLHTAYDSTYVHRGITPDTLLVDSSNLPIFTNFSNSRTPSPITVANVVSIDASAPWTPPEVLKYGVSSADQRSDTYSLCYALRQVLAVNDEKCGMISAVIEDGLVQDPTARKSVKELLQEITDYLEDEEKESIFISNAGISRGDIVSFNGRQYEITEYLGQGGFARAYGVGVPGADTTLYCAKSFVNRKRAEEFLNKCDKLRPLSVKNGFQTVFEVTGNLSHDPIHVLMEYVPGRTLESLRGCCREYIENNLDGNFWHVISDWIKDVLFSLNDLHCSGFVHGDISLGNLIVNENRIAIIDLDSIVPAGERAEFLGTTSYMPVEFLEDRIASPSHDVFSLAAAMFHLIFDKEPFFFSGLNNRSNGVNWTSVNKKGWELGQLRSFIDKATASDPPERFGSASEALQWLDRITAMFCSLGPISLEDACIAAARKIASKLELHREIPKFEDGIENFVDRQPPGSDWTSDKVRSLLSLMVTNFQENVELDATLAELRHLFVTKELRSLEIMERLSKVTKDDFVGVERNGNDVTIHYRGTAEEQAIDGVIASHLADKSSTLWESLADWAYDKECFSIISRRFLQDFAKRFSGEWVPTREQCQWAGELVHRAVENGFSLHEW
jgi:serine/threonine protein kinase